MYTTHNLKIVFQFFFFTFCKNIENTDNFCTNKRINLINLRDKILSLQTRSNWKFAGSENLHSGWLRITEPILMSIFLSVYLFFFATWTPGFRLRVFYYAFTFATLHLLFQLCDFDLVGSNTVSKHRFIIKKITVNRVLLRLEGMQMHLNAQLGESSTSRF